MPIAYPPMLPLPLRASRSRSQPAAFGMSNPRRGPGYVDPTGTDTPVLWDMTWRFSEGDASLFQLWLALELDRGRLEFTLPIRTEFGLLSHTCRFLPDSLLNARQDGATWVYTATIMARAQIIPPAAVTAYGGAFVGPIPAQTVNTGSPFTLSLSSFWSGGLGPFTWSVASGALPHGLTLNTSTGVISGTWTGTASASFNDLVFSRQDLFGVRRHSNQVDFAASAEPAVFVAQSATSSGIFTNSFSIGIPALALPGDFAVMVVAFSTNRSVSNPTGWTLYTTFNVLSSATARVYTRVLQAGDSNPVFTIDSFGTNISAAVYAYRGASGIVAEARSINATSSSTAAFPNAVATKRSSPVVLVHLRDGLSGIPFFSFVSNGNIGTPTIATQDSVSPDACAWMIARGLLSGDNVDTGIVTGSQTINKQYSNLVLVIG